MLQVIKHKKTAVYILEDEGFQESLERPCTCVPAADTVKDFSQSSGEQCTPYSTSKE
jgi:hypothetical protein